MNIPILEISTLCKNVNFTDFGHVGQCLVETSFFGDAVLAGIIIFVLFTALIVKNGFPITTIIPVGMALAFVLYLLTGASIFLGVLLLGLLVGGAVLIIGLLQYINR